MNRCTLFIHSSQIPLHKYSSIIHNFPPPPQGYFEEIIGRAKCGKSNSKKVYRLRISSILTDTHTPSFSLLTLFLSSSFFFTTKHSVKVIYGKEQYLYDHIVQAYAHANQLVYLGAKQIILFQYLLQAN